MQPEQHDTPNTPEAIAEQFMQYVHDHTNEMECKGSSKIRRGEYHTCVEIPLMRDEITHIFFREITTEGEIRSRSDIVVCTREERDAIYTCERLGPDDPPAFSYGQRAYGSRSVSGTYLEEIVAELKYYEAGGFLTKAVRADDGAANGGHSSWRD